VRKGIAQAAAAAWEVRGDSADMVREAHELFLAANTKGFDRRGVAWGSGWNTYLNQHLRAYLLTGNGAFTEVVYDGSRVVGFVHLDPYRCFRTNDPEFPVIYTATTGEKIEMPHHTVFALTDFSSESIDERGCGMCAAERAYDEIRIHSVIQRKFWERIAGRSADTLDFIGGMTQAQIDDIISGAEMKADQKGYTYYMGHILSAIPGDIPLSHVAIKLAGVEPDYERQRDYEIARNRYALALDMDPQDLAPLDSNSVGSASQSRVLDWKSRRTVLFGWDEDWMDSVSLYMLDTSTRFHFSDLTDASELTSKANALNTYSTAAKKLTESFILTPDQGLQVGIDLGVVPDEFIVRQDNSRGPQVLRRGDRSTLLHETEEPTERLPYNVATQSLVGDDGVDFTEDEGQPQSTAVARSEVDEDDEDDGILSRIRNFGKNKKKVQDDAK